MLCEKGEGGTEMKNSVLGVIESVAKLNEKRLALKSTSGELTYGQLWEQSENLAAWLIENSNNDKPIMVYGHKNPQMIVCFLACAKSGRAYCPVDISMPKNRIEEIAEALENKIILATEEFELEGFDVVDSNQIEEICNNKAKEVRSDRSYWRRGEDVFYIIFTSGSTGKPKGVEITADNLKNFAKWSAKHIDQNEAEPVKFLNQAPFSFDLSVMDLYTSLTTGGTLICLDKGLQADVGSMFSYMKENQINCWVSTPSFADMCLADHSFNQDMLEQMNLFLFCGERLAHETAAKLIERFTKARIVNTYGPTESTVAVTSVEITKDVLVQNALLPIGVPKDGTELLIVDEEILITGDTVGKGYYKCKEKTEEAFIYIEDEKGQKRRAYKTGDKGYYENGNYYCTGRLDFQVKLHGYRIELGDIESNLIACEEVEQAAVLPRYDGDKLRSLVAFVKAPDVEGNSKDVKALKTILKEQLPIYMVPKNIKFLKNMPMTANGKLDRKRLEAEFL